MYGKGLAAGEYKQFKERISKGDYEHQETRAVGDQTDEGARGTGENGGDRGMERKVEEEQGKSGSLEEQCLDWSFWTSSEKDEFKVGGELELDYEFGNSEDGSQYDGCGCGLNLFPTGIPIPSFTSESTSVLENNSVDSIANDVGDRSFSSPRDDSNGSMEESGVVTERELWDMLMMVG